MPKVADIVTFADYKEEDMLRLAACLEEHYPHSLANAVVEAAKARGLSHEEYHSQRAVRGRARHFQHGRTTKRFVIGSCALCL